VAPTKDGRLYSISEVCSATGLKEGAVRFYDSLYSEILPQKLYRGDKPFYTQEAVQLLRRIDELKQRGITLPSEVAGRLKHSRHETPSLYSSEKYGKIIVVTSGKGGVGKSNISLNLAIALSQKGLRTALIDADLGLANIHILCGHQPQSTLLDMIRNGSPLAQVLEKGPAGVDLVVGGSGADELANLPRYQRYRLVSELEKLELAYDAVVVDTSPGISKNVTDFLHIADRIILLTTPDLTSTTDAYGLLKTVLSSFPEADIGIACNQSRTQREAEVIFFRLEVCARRFLNATVRNYGHIPRDPAVSRANSMQQPYVLFDPGARVSQATVSLAERALELESGGDQKERSSFRRIFTKGDPFLRQPLNQKEIRIITR
jgi:flagellar biosynthesis protein FlhG